ncbi:MAG TPA: cytochrome P450, partial [Archangium sp.]|nr:cytochrome P450 [Archangium sp.]
MQTTATKIPAPKGWPLLGVAPEMLRNPLPLITRLTRDYGDVVYMPGVDTYLVSEPELVKIMLLDAEEYFTKSPKVMKKLSPAIGAGLSTLSGDTWKRQRRMANPAFSRASIVTFEGIMQKAISEAIADWDGRVGQTLDVTGEMKRLTLRIVLMCLFSADISSRADEIIENLDILQRYSVHLLWSMMPLPEFIPTRRNREYQKARAALDGIIYGIIGERRKNGNHDRKDLLAMYMSAVDEETGEGMSNEQLRNELMNLFLAGHDTTANGLAFTFYLLSRHPEALKRVDEERDAVLGSRMVTNEDLPQLNYARWSFEESLRIYPPTFAMSRTSIRELRHKEYVIPAGSNIFVCQWALHRNPRLWEDPERFD